MNSLRSEAVLRIQNDFFLNPDTGAVRLPIIPPTKPSPHFVTYTQCCGSGSAWISIHFGSVNADPDPGGHK